MFGFFKKKKKSTHQPVLADLNNQPLQEGDIVESMRYDLGQCEIIMGEKGLTYKSIATGRLVSWHLMVDAATDLQKVKKITQ
ncbi:hypothetical protein PZB74_09440 [Porifericola rhodea]|uniref:hypothetical protein n=1 Tax=Porifericola rhodea TaxID=930972 RepID=UPI002666B627|nr:hypothetical protein [Porifericola rhodea]WKN33553.1 hypothetical protein PZB74_09440 [Porifericola rhodea]